MKILIRKDPRYPINLKNVRLKAKEILSALGVSAATELSIVFVGIRKAKWLNETYRKMVYIPEVLAFPMAERGPDEILRLGDVMICFPLAREQAVKRSVMVEEIINELLEHGIKNLVANGNQI